MEWSGGGRTAAVACAVEPTRTWRTPLRDAIGSLAEGLHEIYERDAARYFDDPWAVRDAYGEVVATPERIESWVAEHVKPRAGATNAGTAESQLPSPQSLLEMERGALRLFTSCAWFFDDIGGLEPIEVLRYAARAIELAGAAAVPLEDGVRRPPGRREEQRARASGPVGTSI